MGCSCIGRVAKIKSNIAVNNLQYFKKEWKKMEKETEEQKVENFLKSYKTRIDTECSNISSSFISISDDDDPGDQEYSKRDENKNKEIRVIKN